MKLRTVSLVIFFSLLMVVHAVARQNLEDSAGLTAHHYAERLITDEARGGDSLNRQGTSEVRPFFRSLSDALANGEITLFFRPRAEFVSQDLVQNAEAVTHRLQLGYTTADLYGFSGHVDFIHSFAYTPKRFNAAGLNNRPERAVVADPKLTVLNQMFAAFYDEASHTRAQVGRQRLILDDARFIGNVGWRQNEQTVDGVVLESGVGIEHLRAHYSYFWQVNRVLGPQHPAGIFDSDSHLLNVSYAGLPFTTVTGYGYFLSFSGQQRSLSSDTYGGSVQSRFPMLNDRFELDLHLSYARQESASGLEAQRGASADYYRAGGSIHKPSVAHVGITYEQLGSGGDQFSFNTPLATLHAHQGWADQLLATPVEGIRDLHVFGSLQLPADVTLFGRFHWFSTDSDSQLLARELNLSASKKISQMWSVLLKYADFWTANDATPIPLRDTRKFWIQMEFRF
ncbi:MAG: hypothetical protein ACNA78_01000 [Balneolaceae bacterium]